VISISWKKGCRALQNSGTLAEVSIPFLQMPLNNGGKKYIS
jgi:hypothetical protein